MAVVNQLHDEPVTDREQVTQLINAAAILTSHIRPEMGGAAMSARALVLAEIERTREQFGLEANPPRDE